MTFIWTFATLSYPWFCSMPIGQFIINDLQGRYGSGMAELSNSEWGVFAF